MARWTDTIYDNTLVLSKEGKPIFRCSQKRAQRYLEKHGATCVHQNPLVIQLASEWNSPWKANQFELSAISNVCVVCGTTKRLSRHHVVPYAYRRYLRNQYHHRNGAAILVLCCKCHDLYEKKATDLKRRLAHYFKAPLDGLSPTAKRQVWSPLQNSRYSFTISKKTACFTLPSVESTTA